MSDYIFKYEMDVRDYELDFQGVVNNSNYQHYLEHTRHEFMLSLGPGFGELVSQGIAPVVTRVEIHYKTPLRSGDTFLSRLYVRREGIRYVFYQEIVKPTGECCVKAVVDTVFTRNGRPTRGDEFAPYYNKLINAQ